MASFNKVIIMGNLTRDPDVRAAGVNGMKVARLGVAINERRRDRTGQMLDFPVFVDVDAWDRLAELCGQHLAKGSPVLVEGRLQMDTWARGREAPEAQDPRDHHQVPPAPRPFAVAAPYGLDAVRAR